MKITNWRDPRTNAVHKLEDCTRDQLLDLIAYLSAFLREAQPRPRDPTQRSIPGRKLAA